MSRPIRYHEDTLLPFDPCGVDHKYINLQLYAKPSNQDPVPALVSATRNQAIIDRPCDWECSIIRFALDISFIPLNIPVVDNTHGPNSTIYSVTLEYQGQPYQEFVIYESSNLSGRQEFQPSVWTYQQWLDSVNKALAAAWLALTTAHPLTGSTAAPAIYYTQPGSGSGISGMNLFHDSAFIYDASLPNVPIFIYSNIPMFNTYLNFQSDYFGLSAGRDVRFVITPDNAVVLGAAPRIGLPAALQGLPVNLYMTPQRARTMETWDSLKSIYMTTGQIPINPEIVPSFQTGVSSNQNSNIASSQLPIITDFLAGRSPDPSINRGIVEYLPTAEYRMVDLQGDRPIYTADVQAYYQTYSGQSYPLYITPSSVFTVKLLFRAKRH